jgi:hypothetical protein
MRKALSVSAILFAAAFIVSLAGCSSGNDDQKIDPNRYKTLLYMTDTISGKIYSYDPATRSASSLSLAATGQNSTGELVFQGGFGFACVADYLNTAPGLYRFDPSAANPSFSRIGTTIDAQYLAFIGSAKAYVTTLYDGLYSFDPSSANPSFSLVPGTSGLMLQEVVAGADGKAYAADNGNGAVLRIDPADDSIASIATTKAGTTGIVAGTYDGTAGVFVANTGGYDKDYNPLPGSIDFIPTGSAAVPSATAVASALAVGGGSIYPARLVQLPGGDLVATGYGHTYMIDLSGDSPAVTELKASGAPFGSLDIAYKDGLIYVPVPDYSGDADRLYIFDAEGSQATYSPVSGVMGAGDTIANIAFYSD